jgi:hypothetical protein
MKDACILMYINGVHVRESAGGCMSRGRQGEEGWEVKVGRDLSTNGLTWRVAKEPRCVCGLGIRRLTRPSPEEQ